MTSYSICRPDSDDPDDVRHARLETFIMGAARCLLSSRTEVLTPDTDHHDDTETVYAEAEWWHSAREGWELDALAPDDRKIFSEACEWFVTGHWADLDTLTAEIVEHGGEWGRSLGWAWYRAGMLFVYNTNSEGIGFWEYGDAGRRLADAVQESDTEISAFCYDQDAYPGVETYVHLN